MYFLNVGNQFIKHDTEHIDADTELVCAQELRPQFTFIKTLWQRLIAAPKDCSY
jgi:hypothetical protein